MIIDLSGKCAVISGSSTGIGFAIAKGLAHANANVILNGKNSDNVFSATEKLSQAYPAVSVEGVVADLSTAKGIESLFSVAPNADILINNVGIYESKKFSDINDEDWYRIFDINVMSAVRLSRLYHPLMIKKKWGRIIFISSESALNIPTDMIHYAMTKTALLAISRGLAEASAEMGVTVNAVLPGPTRSEGVLSLLSTLSVKNRTSQFQLESEFIQKYRPSSLLQRLATVDEVANMVVYACSPHASATNGAALRVDGGVVRSII